MVVCHVWARPNPVIVVVVLRMVVSMPVFKLILTCLAVHRVTSTCTCQSTMWIHFRSPGSASRAILNGVNSRPGRILMDVGLQLPNPILYFVLQLLVLLIDGVVHLLIHACRWWLRMGDERDGRIILLRVLLRLNWGVQVLTVGLGLGSQFTSFFNALHRYKIKKLK